MVLTAECTVCFTFWLMHSHNLPTLFYCIYIWPHTKIYRCMCGVWPLYRTCPSDRHPDGWSCQRLCVLLIKQSNDPVCRPHTHTQHELTNTLRHTEKWYDEERRNCKRRWGKYFFFSFLLSELTTCQDCQRNSMILFHVYQKYKNWGSEASGLFKWNVGSHQTNSHDSVWVFVLVSKSDIPRHQEPSEKREYLMLKSSFLSIKQCKWLHFQCLWQINRLQTCFDYLKKKTCI